MKGAPRSDQFDDIYFSAQDGLAETRHVFMQGNGLPDFWQDKPTFTIAETGFGTGLNFLCAWKEFVETADPSQRLDFVSFEKFPLSVAEVHNALKPWAEELGEYTQKLIESYPIRIGGFHRIVFDDRVALTLIFGDVNEYIPELEAKVDCWFLDGFTPAKNPDMWSETLFQNMARLSAQNSRFATFTAAGDVKRGLQAAGFSVSKTDGFGRKRDMLVGSYEGGEKEVRSSRPKKVAVIGGGLAGTACAYTLKQYGFVPVIYEASSSLASGASGNAVGLFNTRFAALRDTESEFFNSAYAQIIRTAKQADAIDYHVTGTLHLVNNETKEQRYDKMFKNWHWHEDHIQLLSKEQASEVAGVELDHRALYLIDAGALCPAKLCEFYARGIDVHLNHKVESLTDIEADAYVLANAFGAKDLTDQFLSEVDGLPVYNVRGQVSIVDSSERLKHLKANICYGGYVSTSASGQQVVGSTFKKWINHTDVLDEDDQENIKYLKDSISALSKEMMNIKGARAGMRLSSQDHFPIVGKVPELDNVYSSVAFGSHGIVGSIAAAHLIADQLRGGPYSLPARTVKQLNAQRFIDRAQKKNPH
ncbi:MAG: bifunctional tRNA (5-methylaminomethyl-2-thiouridine)(34)-methyltransferase MnmD/FAD-dependent 5-carboxymethylaminomethyl-2-thiouridine(34) oxidoreductase MnmC [Micavibrio sp.]|nr:bifunctional tRNA (5-methylaminomethyl-2-thiouridine)(34)-methyltransferase MnmD/FAD-dependent 5-carboxymethylaminomethyl-2-thiouridine(34) oxidoreductase MnmC [Micavibrio sp.]